MPTTFINGNAKTIYLFIFFMFLVSFIQAQNDTAVGYLNKDWEQSDTNNASYKTKIFPVGKKWHMQVFGYSDGQLTKEFIYSDKELHSLDTSFSYISDGKIEEDIYSKDDGIYRYPVKKQLLSPSKKMIAYATFGKNLKITEQKGYDENGKEIPNYIFWQDASFPGGESIWLKYLRNNLNTHIPEQNGAPTGTYRVAVSFLIDKDGNATEVKALNDPGFGCAEEAVRIIQKSPKWNTAIQYNKPATSNLIKQLVIFVVQKD